MTEQELKFMLMHARAVVAEGLLEFLAGKLLASDGDGVPRQTVVSRDQTTKALEAVAQLVEGDLLRSRAAQKYSVEERNLIADEFRAILEETKRKVGG